MTTDDVVGKCRLSCQGKKKKKKKEMVKKSGIDPFLFLVLLLYFGMYYTERERE